jgi:hypothetical protein
MGLHKALHDGKSKAGTPALRVGRLPEPVENVLEVRFRDSWSRIGDGEDDLVSFHLCAQSDATAGLAELDRIPDQILEYLVEPIAVGPGVRQIRRKRRSKLQTG